MVYVPCVCQCLDEPDFVSYLKITMAGIRDHPINLCQEY